MPGHSVSMPSRLAHLPKVVLTFMCLIVILAVADNAGKRDLPIGGAVPDGLVGSVLSKSAAAEPWPSSLLLDGRDGK